MHSNDVGDCCCVSRLRESRLLSLGWCCQQRVRFFSRRSVGARDPPGGREELANWAGH